MKSAFLFFVIILLAALLVITGCHAKTYEVDYCGEKQMYDGAKDSYAPGTSVTLRYTLFAEDTSYAFYLDGEKLSVNFDSAKGYFIRFTMPDHNVRLECVTENTMTDTISVPETEPAETPSPDEIPEPEEIETAQDEPVTEPEEISEPENPTAVPTETVKQTRFLKLIKSYTHNKKWNEDETVLLADSKYSNITLDADDAAEFPELAEILEQQHQMRMRSMDDEFDNLVSFAEEALAGIGPAPFRTQISTLDLQVRRADSLVVSLLADSYADHSLIEGYRAFQGITLDSATGRELTIHDVIRKMDDVVQVIKQELNSHMWSGEFYSETAVEDYFINTPTDGFSWTLDYNGITFYFMPGDLCEPGFGYQTATVSFASHPDLFEEKYFSEPAEYIAELPVNAPFFANLDEDPDLEELNFTGFKDDGGRFYQSFGIYTDIDAHYLYADEIFAFDIHPYYVKTADNRHYLYIFLEQTEEGSREMKMLVYDVAGQEFTKIGEMNACPGFMFPDSFIQPTDPSAFRLDNRDSADQEEVYTVGENGMPVKKQ